MKVVLASKNPHKLPHPKTMVKQVKNKLQRKVTRQQSSTRNPLYPPQKRTSR